MNFEDINFVITPPSVTKKYVHEKSARFLDNKNEFRRYQFRDNTALRYKEI